jgi:uncharacterized membrane protein YfcA
MDIPTLAGIFIIVTASATLQGAVGYGLNIIAAPLLMMFEPAMVPGPIIVAALTLTILMIWRNRDGVDLRGVSWMVLGALPGTALAAWMLPLIPVRVISYALAGLVLLGVVISLSGVHFPARRWILVVAGFVSGYGSTLASIGGPPVALINQDLPGPRLRATLATYFTILSIVSLISLAPAGRFGGRELQLSLVLLPGVVLGFLLSKPLTRFLDRGYTRIAILSLSAVAAVLLIIQQVMK